MRISGVIAMLAGFVACLGCSSKDNLAPSDETTADAAMPAADAASATADAAPDVLAPPAVGIQLASTPVAMAPGEEQYLCWSFVIPANGPAINVIATEPMMSPHGLHHYAVFTKSGAVPANPVAYGCKVMDATWSLVSGGGVGTPGLTFPTGTAMTLAPGTQLVLQLHLLNATAAVENPTGIINLVGSTATNLTQVGLLIAGTLDIDLPPHSMGVKVQGGCAAPFDMPNVFALFPHMHQLGTNIEMTLTPQGAKTPDVLIDRAWDFGSQGVYPATGSAKTGDQVSIECTYDNTTANTVTFGESTTNEMCLGVFYYWPMAANGMGGLGGANYCGI
jgi:hypothetical protein